MTIYLFFNFFSTYLVQFINFINNRTSLIYLKFEINIIKTIFLQIILVILTSKIQLNINKDQQYQVLRLNKRCPFDTRQYLFGIVYVLFHFQTTKVQYSSTLKFANSSFYCETIVKKSLRKIVTIVQNCATFAKI